MVLSVRLLLLLLMLMRLAPVGTSSCNSGKRKGFCNIRRFYFRGVISEISQVYLFAYFYQPLFKVFKINMQSFGKNVFNGGITEFSF